MSLLVFDPAYRPGRQLRKLMGEPGSERGMSPRKVKKILRPFIRGEKELSRFARFETLTVTETKT